MDLGEALKEIKTGAKFTRLNWHDRDKYVTLLDGELVFVRSMIDFGGSPKVVPWRPVTEEVMADDWVEIEEAEAEIPLVTSEPEERKEDAN